MSLSGPEYIDALADAPAAFGPPPATGRLRSTPEDFVVEERLGFEPDGAGPHVLLVVEKRGANTGWVAAQLARLAGVAPREVGWAGHKDRNALTRQAYTLPWPAAAPLDPCLAWSGEGYRVLAASRHGRKLRPGSHRGNRFALRVCGVAGPPAPIEARLAEIAARGVPNYFGPQRFGRSGSNLARARDWAAGGRPPRARDERAFALSAARSALFNAVLAERVRTGTWDRLLPGDVAVLEGRRSFFRVDEPDATLAGRCAALDLHPSGPLHGRGASPASGEAGALETGILVREAALCSLLESQGLDQERRPLRLPVSAFSWSLGEGTLSLGFELPRGAFATALLHELLVDAWTAGEGGD